jgi:hypothetical protein
MLEIFNGLFQQANAEASRSTALKPLGWLIAMLLPSTLAAFYYLLPAAITGTLMLLTVISVLAYLGAYVYFLKVDPDALRSETYSLKKLAIQRGIFGDSTHGTVDIDPDPATHILIESKKTLK